MAIALEFDRVSKRYEGHMYRTLRDTLSAAGGAAIGRRRPRPEVERALDDLTFTVEEGESLAIVGRNGAGKSTALKLATRILYPTAGTIRVRGRVSALIEVGTGMHPELTGRENVQLFGRILGFTPREIARRFDEIVEFAGVERALDYPVKYYSSGMQLRLGFSLAVHLEPDVLLVDEAISVGDAGFQYRCVERMRDVVRNGHTIVFVSHDMAAVEALCSRVILLDQGRLVADGPPAEVIHDYLATAEAERPSDAQQLSQPSELEIEAVTLQDASGAVIDEIPSGSALTVRIDFHMLEPVHDPQFSVGVAHTTLGCFSLATMLVDGGAPAEFEQAGRIDCHFHSLPLTPGTYEIWLSVRDSGGRDIVEWSRRKAFEISADPVWEVAGGALARTVVDAPVKLDHHWSTPGRSG